MSLTLKNHPRTSGTAIADADLAKVALTSLMDFLWTIEKQASPYPVALVHVRLLRCERRDATGAEHMLRIGTPGHYLPPMDEIVDWQIRAGIRKQQLTLDCRWVFHTFIGDRSGDGVGTINGKPYSTIESHGGWSLQQELAECTKKEAGSEER